MLLEITVRGAGVFYRDCPFLDGENEVTARWKLQTILNRKSCNIITFDRSGEFWFKNQLVKVKILPGDKPAEGSNTK